MIARMLLRALSAAALVSCGGERTVDPPDGTHSALFIGNSLTYANDLPGTFALLTAGSDEAFQVTSVAKPNVALIDFFFDDGEALSRIDHGHFDFVVMQQGPTWPGLCGDTLALAASQFASRIRAVGGTPALLMTWPALGDQPYWDGVETAYRSAAHASGSLLSPAGTAWRIAWGERADLPLYDSDNYHPSPLGTLLTAFTVYETLTGNDVRSLPSSYGPLPGVSEDVVHLLQRAAHDAAHTASSPAGLRAGAVAAITC
jgi:hypothetical protein